MDRTMMVGVEYLYTRALNDLRNLRIEEFIFLINFIP